MTDDLPQRCFPSPEAADRCGLNYHQLYKLVRRDRVRGTRVASEMKHLGCGCWVAYCVATICFAQSAARSNSPSCRGPSIPLTMNPSGGRASAPPFFFSRPAIGSAA